MSMKTSNRKNLLILSFTLVVIMLGFGMVIPIMPFYIESMGASGLQLGLLVASYGVMRLIFAPLWGSLSDRVGRKPILLIGVFGNGLTLLLFGLSTQLWMLFLARSLSGVLSSATSPTTMAYISDSTSEEDRGGGMGMLGAAVGLGTVIGPGLGGWLAGESLARPFYIAAALSVVSLLLILFLLPESLPPEARQASGNKKTFLPMRQMWAAISSPLGILLVMAFLVAFSGTIFYAIFGLYALEKFGYGTGQVGTILMVVGLVSALTQGLMTGPLTKRWGEALVIKLSLLATSIGFLIMIPVNSFVTVLLTTGIFILATSLLTPAVSALTSKWVTMDQGVTMGLSNSFMSLGRIFGPLFAGFLFDQNLNFPYIGGALVMFIGFLFSLVWVTQEPNKESGVSLAGLTE
jgi:DHA1 family multidrug resistance protein-like MFS transporter